MENTVSLGKKGEEKAAVFLEKKGLQILAKNFRSPFGEIDLVCKEKNQIVFVEVKTRTSLSFGDGAEAISLQKINRIVKTAYHFLKTQHLENAPFRFDVVSLLLDKQDIIHIPNAFP
jgi:putative endonuclease